MLDGTPSWATGTLHSRCVTASSYQRKRGGRGRPGYSRVRELLVGSARFAGELLLRAARELLGLVDRLLERGAHRAFMRALEHRAVAGVDDDLGLAFARRVLH